VVENESLLDRQVNPDPPKSNRRKLRIIFIAVVLFGLGALVGNGLYRYYSAVNSLNQYEKDYNARIEAERLAKMADTYGGKTPAETLSLYIEAVKKGDYELASKYFVEKDRQVDLDNFSRSTKESLQVYISNLEFALANANDDNGYNSDKTAYIIDKPILLDFVFYPNGIWKLTEI